MKLKLVLLTGLLLTATQAANFDYDDDYLPGGLRGGRSQGALPDDAPAGYEEFVAAMGASGGGRVGRISTAGQNYADAMAFRRRVQGGQPSSANPVTPLADAAFQAVLEASKETYAEETRRADARFERDTAAAIAASLAGDTNQGVRVVIDSNAQASR